MVLKQRISLITILGIVSGFGLFFWAIYNSTSNYVMFLSLNSLTIVLGGTLAASMMAYHGLYVFRTLKSLFFILVPYHVSGKTLKSEVQTLINWARINQQQGMKALEESIDEDHQKEPYVRYGIELLSAGYDVKTIKENLTNSLETTFERHMVQANILQTMASFSPAFGMIGTLVGLIIMLDNMGGDISKIGPGLAIALLTTLYGVLFAQLLFKPAAEKIQQTMEIVRYRHILIREGLILISQKKGPFEVQDKLNGLLSPQLKVDLSEDSGE